MKTTEEAIAWIHSRLPFGSRPGLERVQALLAMIDHPEAQVPTIHIAGTNGKGSTVSYLRSMLTETGVTVGSFTSPFIETFNERIQIDGQNIPDEDLLALANKFKPLVEELDQQENVAGITEFETMTAMALDYFLAKKVDVAIIEVGLGGLMDSTNIVQPMLTAITTIGMDHTDILGETIEEIAQQKAGIIKTEIPLVTGKIVPNALEVILAEAKKKQAPVYRYDEEFRSEYLHPDEAWGEVFAFYNEQGRISNLKTSLIGRQQPENAAVAIQLYYLYCHLAKLPVIEKNIINGVRKTFWPARMERLSEEPLIILDGAHNPHAMKRLVENMQQEFRGYRINVLFSALSTKDVDLMLKMLLEIPNVHIYLTTFDYPKAIELSNPSAVIQDSEKISIVSLWQFGLAEILEKNGEGDLLLVTGSLYFVSEVRSLLLEMGGNQEHA